MVLQVVNVETQGKPAAEIISSSPLNPTGSSSFSPSSSSSSSPSTILVSLPDIRVETSQLNSSSPIPLNISPNHNNINNNIHTIFNNTSNNCSSCASIVPNLKSNLSNTNNSSGSSSPGFRRIPSTPTFKKSASVIYEEEDEDTEEGIECGAPPHYFELTPITSIVSATGRKRKAFMREESVFLEGKDHHQDIIGSGDHNSIRAGRASSAASNRHNRRSTDPNPKKMSDPVDGLTFVLSALYAKLLVIIGLCFPMAEVISHRIPIGWYEGFYLYMYLGSVLFLLVTYACRENKNKKRKDVMILAKIRGWLCWSSAERMRRMSIMMMQQEQQQQINVLRGEPAKFSVSSTESSLNEDAVAGVGLNQVLPHHFGSFYLRLGAVAFGIGSMIYSGLEFGQFFELESKEQCYSFLYGFTPSAHMAFTFFQLYFIFMNSRAFISKHAVMGMSLFFSHDDHH